MKRLIVIVVSLVSFIAASLAIINFVSEKKILKNPKEFIKNPTEYIQKVEDQNKQDQARRLAEEQEKIRREKEREEAARRTKANRKLLEYPQKSEAETLLIFLLVLIAIGVSGFLIYKYVISQPAKDEYNSTNYFEDQDDFFS